MPKKVVRFGKLIADLIEFTMHRYLCGFIGFSSLQQVFIALCDHCLDYRAL